MAGDKVMTLSGWEESLTAIELWMLRTYSLSISFQQGWVPKSERCKVQDLLNWSLSRRLYNSAHARELYTQWLDRLELVENQPSV